LIRRRRLASHFFCKRDQANLSDPAVIWRTVASDLAKFSCEVKIRLLEFFQKAYFRDADILLHFHCLIVDPLTQGQSFDHLAAELPVIVIDALDECGPGESQSAQRRIFLETIALWSHHLPSSFKLVITSRDERVPTSFYNPQLCHHIVLETGNQVSCSTADDIRIYFQNSFASITPPHGLEPTWPRISDQERLIELAAGLFIWAKTTVEFIAQKNGNPVTRLQLVLDGGLLGDAQENIDSLYRQILLFAFGGASGHTLELFRGVVGTIAAAKTPIHQNDLKYFLGKEDAEDDRQIRSILYGLSSVIARGDDGLLHLRHLSFIEFLQDVKRCPQFFIGQHRQNLALLCLRLMNQELRFNICGWETSHCRNDDMKQSNLIPAYLSYSCRFWAEHLQDNHDQRDRRILLKEMRDFLHNRLLFWLEVLSLNKEMPVAQLALLTAISWLGVSVYHVGYQTLCLMILCQDF